MKPTWIRRVDSSASRLTTSSEVSTSVVSGFSHITGLGVFQAGEQLLLVGGSRGGEKDGITSASAIASSGSAIARQPGMAAASCSAFSVRKSLTTATRAPEIFSTAAGDVVGAHHADAENRDTRSTWFSISLI